MFQKYRPTFTLDQASLRLLQATPCGNSASGSLKVSIVGVIAPFTSQTIGPSPIRIRTTNTSTCDEPKSHFTERRSQSLRESSPQVTSSRLPAQGDHVVLQERVARMKTSAKTARNAARLTAVG